MSKFYIIADIPAGSEKQLLQHIRDFDSAHPGCHFKIIGDAPDATIEEVTEMLRISPAFQLFDIIRRPRT